MKVFFFKNHQVPETASGHVVIDVNNRSSIMMLIMRLVQSLCYVLKQNSSTKVT
jgi:hypothetical protein